MSTFYQLTADHDLAGFKNVALPKRTSADQGWAEHEIYGISARHNECSKAVFDAQNEARMHPTIKTMLDVVAKGDENAIKDLLAEDVMFKPPTYYKTWTGRDPVAAVLGHVGHVFSDFKYRRIMGEGVNWACEFECKIGALDAVGVDLITLDDAGLIACFEVVMRPYKSVGALREAMNHRVMRDARFLEYKDALS